MLEHIPPLEETAYDAALEPTEAAAGAGPGSSASAAADLAALLGLDAGMAGARAPAGQTITAFQSGPLTVSFRLEKQPGSPADTDILASYSNSGSQPLEGFTLQAAVPKQMTLRLEPASGSSVPAHSSGSVTQRLHVHNSLAGQKPLVMRLRISYQLGGQPVLEQAEVSTFPPRF